MAGRSIIAAEGSRQNGCDELKRRTPGPGGGIGSRFDADISAFARPPLRGPPSDPQRALRGHAVGRRRGGGRDHAARGPSGVRAGRNRPSSTFGSPSETGFLRGAGFGSAVRRRHGLFGGRGGDGHPAGSAQRSLVVACVRDVRVLSGGVGLRPWTSGPVLVTLGSRAQDESGIVEGRRASSRAGRLRAAGSGVALRASARFPLAALCGARGGRPGGLTASGTTRGQRPR